MRLAVLDTNVVVSAAISPQSPPGKLVMEWVLEKRLYLLISPLVVAEYRDVFQREKFKKYDFPPLWSERIVELGVHLPEPPAWPHDLPDQTDAPFLALAHATGACVVTGNLKHFPPTASNGVTVLSPADYLESLTAPR